MLMFLSLNYLCVIVEMLGKHITKSAVPVALFKDLTHMPPFFSSTDELVVIFDRMRS